MSDKFVSTRVIRISIYTRYGKRKINEKQRIFPRGAIRTAFLKSDTAFPHQFLDAVRQAKKVLTYCF